MLCKTLVRPHVAYCSGPLLRAHCTKKDKWLIITENLAYVHNRMIWYGVNSINTTV